MILDCMQLTLCAHASSHRTAGCWAVSRNDGKDVHLALCAFLGLLMFYNRITYLKTKTYMLKSTQMDLLLSSCSFFLVNSVTHRMGGCAQLRKSSAHACSPGRMLAWRTTLLFSWGGSRHGAYTQTGEYFWGSSEPPYTKEWYRRKQHSPRLDRGMGCADTPASPCGFKSTTLRRETPSEKKKQVLSELPEKAPHGWVHHPAGGNPCGKESGMGLLANSWGSLSELGNCWPRPPAALEKAGLLLPVIDHATTHPPF